MTTLLIESNRAIANSLINNDQEQSIGIVDTRHQRVANNANWSTTIDTGIELQPGDQISMENCALNVRGAGGGQFLQFNGADDTSLPDGTFKSDNKAQIQIAYYVNNNAQFNMPLPKGSATIVDCNIQPTGDASGIIDENFGMPDLTGKNIWGVLITGQEYPILPTATTVGMGNMLHPSALVLTDPTAAPTATHPNGGADYYPCIYGATRAKKLAFWAFNHGWCMNRNGYFKNGFNPATFSHSGVPAGTDTDKKRNTLDYIGYHAWTDNTAQKGMPGIAFGQKNMFLDNTFNDNIDNKDNAFNRTSTEANTTGGTTIPAIEGGAAPYLCKTKNIRQYVIDPIINNMNNAFSGMYTAGERKTGGLFLPIDFDSFNQNAYDDILTFYPTLYKGGGFNHRQNGNRLYCSEIYNEEKRNMGPFYNNDTNVLIPENVKGLTKLDFKTHKRDNRYFNFLQQTIDLEVGAGNIAPERIGEIITEQMKERGPNMALPEDQVDIGAEIFITYLFGPNNSGPLNETTEPVLKKNIAQLTSKTYKTYPTVNGYCWNAKVTKPKTSIQGWDAIEEEQTYDGGSLAASLQVGDKYKSAQAYEKFYANMLVGNPFEWKVVCELHPILQACPMTLHSTSLTGFNYLDHSILAGFDEGVAVKRTVQKGIFDVPAGDPVFNTTLYRNGNLGCFPCLIDDNFPFEYTTNFQKSYVASWYCGTFSASKSYNAPADVDPTLNYNIEALNCKNYQLYDEACRRPYLNVRNLDVFATNILFDAQVELSDFDNNMDKIKKHGNKFPSSNPNGDSLNSQSEAFFNNTYVEWVMGRIDDQYSYPENESLNIPKAFNPGSTLDPTAIETGSATRIPKVIKGREGTPIYLPNIFQTNILYGGRAGLATPSITGATGNITGILSAHRKTIGTDASFSGSYMMRNMRTGVINEDHNTYTLNSNPQSVFVESAAVAASGIYDPTGRNDGNIAKKFFGLPCWSTYADDFIDEKNTQLNSAYKKGMRRAIHGYRYLPENQLIGGKVNEYNVHSAFNKTLNLGIADSTFTTCPKTYTFERLKALWDKITVLNKGKGIGIIPIFYKAVPTQLRSPTFDEIKFLEIPFCGIIAQGQTYTNIPVPVKGEFIMLGSSPSLQQNDLHHPVTTQQVQKPNSVAPLEFVEQGLNPENEYITNNCGIKSFKAIKKANPITRYSDTENDGKYVPTDGAILTEIFASEGTSISNIIYTGANDPLCAFDTTFNRFSFLNLHTQMFKGNGVFQLGSFGPDTNPESVTRFVNGKNAAISQQVELPACYYQKFDDMRPRASTPTTGNMWNLFNLRLSGAATMGYDRYNPGRVKGGTLGEIVGGGQFRAMGIRPLMTNSIEGNIIRQTFDQSVYGPGTTNPQNQAELKPGGTDDPTRIKGNRYHNNFEPGGMCSYEPSGSNVAVDGPPMIGNVHSYVPFNATQFTVRLLNDEGIITGAISEDGEKPDDDILGPTIRPYAYIQQDSSPYLFNSAQSGIGILGMNIIKSNGISIIPLTNTDYNLFEGSMFFKLGFELNQLLPLFSQVQTQYNNTLYNKFAGPNKSSFQAFNNMLFPVTTNSRNTTSVVPAAVGGFGTGSASSNRSFPNTLMPMFNLGMVRTAGTVNANSDSIIAERLPTRLSFPYLVLRSNIATPCGNQYIGGANGQQFLPAVSYLMTSYASDDFFYTSRSDLVFTVNRPYVLTELVSSIHFPNGKLATDILGLNTAVIYRIDFAQRVPQIPQQIQEKENEKEKDKKDKK